MTAELFKTVTGVNITHVPYKSTGPALIAVINGEVAIIMPPLARSKRSVLPLQAGGKDTHSSSRWQSITYFCKRSATKVRLGSQAGAIARCQDERHDTFLHLQP